MATEDFGQFELTAYGTAAQIGPVLRQTADSLDKGSLGGGASWGWTDVPPYNWTFKPPEQPRRRNILVRVLLAILNPDP